MSSRLIISPTSDLHLAPFQPCALIRKSYGTHLTKLFAHVHSVSLEAVPLPPFDLVTVSSFTSEQISTVMCSTACSKVDELLYQGREGLYVLRLPT
jgi:hypothetical protein